MTGDVGRHGVVTWRTGGVAGHHMVCVARGGAGGK